ncbi:MAG: hypothetical protein R2695_16230 [Acidimicrobiales bacterium]
MYTPDVYLFAEPFADEIGAPWEAGLRRVLIDLADLATPGGAISWGRSTGALGIVMTIELAAVAAGRGLVDDAGPWLGKAEAALRSLTGWFHDGVVTAHQHKMTMSYRGPERRLQMTRDLLGKLVQAAHELRRAKPVTAAPPARSFGPVDRFVVFDPERRSGAWAHRGSGIDFVVPYVGGWSGDYLPAPRLPGTFEVPVESQRLVSWLPALHADGTVRTVSGPPSAIHHEVQALAVTHEGFRTLDLAASGAAAAPIEGARSARYRVEGRSLVVTETLTIDRDPATIDAVSIEVPEVAARPLTVEWSVPHPHTTTVVDTAGMQAHRSFWNEHARVHELVVEPAAELRFEWRVTPALRVVSTANQHWYNESLYAPSATGWSPPTPAASSTIPWRSPSSTSSTCTGRNGRRASIPTGPTRSSRRCVTPDSPSCGPSTTGCRTTSATPAGSTRSGRPRPTSSSITASTDGA